MDGASNYYLFVLCSGGGASTCCKMLVVESVESLGGVALQERSFLGRSPVFRRRSRQSLGPTSKSQLTERGKMAKLRKMRYSRVKYLCYGSKRKANRGPQFFGTLFLLPIIRLLQWFLRYPFLTHSHGCFLDQNTAHFA